ncbi:MAG: restriction endonuclease subunit S [Imperialibacter sp.]|uniref:restriction endonuclease subunit S n=1 Tax=Imperialibacter sp. TaxID=2038411 RepID=UPI0032EE3F6B
MILSEVTEFIIDCEHKTAPIQAEGIPSIRTPNIGKGNLILDGVNRVSESTYKEWTKRGEPKEGDLIIAREAPVGNVAIVPKNLRVCLGQRTVLVRPNREIVDSRYLCYLLLGDELQGQITTKTSGATVAHLNMKDIRELRIKKLPPLPTQQKIASILSAYDDLIENNNQRIKLLEEMAEEIYKEWFVRLRFPGYKETRFIDPQGKEVPHGTPGALPEGWETVPLTKMVRVLSGGTPKTSKPEYWNGQIPFFTPKDYTGERYCYSTEGNITELGLRNCNSRLYGEDTIVVTARGTVGNIALLGRPMAMNQSCFAIEGKDDMPNYFVYGLLADTAGHLKTVANGATFNAINIKTFEQTKVVMPIGTLAMGYHLQVAPLFKMLKMLLQKNQLLQQTRDLLLPRLMSGKLDVGTLPYQMNEEPLSMVAEDETIYQAKRK